MELETLRRLKSDLKRAREIARLAASAVDDGGTCNMDSVIIPTGRSHPLKRRSPELDEIFGGERFDARWTRGYMLVYAYGQGNKRLAAAEAAAKALNAWNAHVWYQMD